VTLGIIIPGCIASERLDRALDLKNDKNETTVVDSTSEQTELQETAKVYVTCPDCTPIEQEILAFFQQYGIEDKNSLAVLLSNIKQESKFQTRVCEGGRLTGYHGCHRGGFGLVQWTTQSRYGGLGRHSRAIGKDPNSLEAQLSWLVNETEWKQVSHRFKTPGQSLNYYMDTAWSWLRWGVFGPRNTYAHQYLSKFK